MFNGLTIPEGNVVKIEVGGKVLWQKAVEPPTVAVYDDELPVQWNSYEVSVAANAKTSGLVKISNLTPSEEEMKSAVVTVGDETFTYIETSVQDGIPSYWYWSEQNRVVITVCATIGATYFPETGMYVDDVYKSKGVIADYSMAMIDEPDTPTGIYDDEFPIEWTMADLGNNATYNALTKVSSLIPTVDELKTATVTMYVTDGVNELTADCIYTSDTTNDDGHPIVFFADAVYGMQPVFTIVPEGDATQESGLYWYDLAFFNENIEGLTIRCSLNLAQSATQYLYGHIAPSTVSYNGVVLPDIESVWTDELKQQYPYVYIIALDIGDGAVYGSLILSESTPTYNTETMEHLLYCGYAEYQFANNQELAAMFDLPATNVWCLTGEGSSDGNITLDRSTWCNHDILNTDGSVYLAASDPVKSYPDATVIVDGVGYVGAVLPALPEWDKTAYPYAFISNAVMNQVIFFALAECPATNGTATNKGTIINPYDSSIPLVQSFLSKDGNSWRELTVSSLGTEGQISLPFWANFDVYYADNTVYLSATDPIPVSGLVKHLCNGYVLPKLPEWDKVTYPYAVVIGDSGGNFWACTTRLILSTVPLYHYNGFAYFAPLYSSAAGSCIGYDWAELNDNGAITYDVGFVRNEELNNTFTASGQTAATNGVGTSLLWANYDVYKHPDGTTLQLEASEPIPIYE